jgi:acyl-CoA reductase-like NAD-dependent aldehyde dehydrogenase
VELLADGESAAPVTQPARAQVIKSVTIAEATVADEAVAEAVAEAADIERTAVRLLLMTYTLSRSD